MTSLRAGVAPGHALADQLEALRAEVRAMDMPPAYTATVRGRGAELDPPFAAHYHLLGNDKYGITSLQNLAELPPTGAVIVVAPLPIVGGTGSPTRVYALVNA